MSLTRILVRDADEFIMSVVERLKRAHLQHYERDGEEATRARVRGLYELLLRVVVERNPDTLADFAARVGRERFADGFDLSELQTAINAMEEILWTRLAARLGTDKSAAEDLSLMVLILGTLKDELARVYVSLASATRAPTLDLRRALADRLGA